MPRGRKSKKQNKKSNPDAELSEQEQQEQPEEPEEPNQSGAEEENEDNENEVNENEEKDNEENEEDAEGEGEEEEEQEQDDDGNEDRSASKPSSSAIVKKKRGRRPGQKMNKRDNRYRVYIFKVLQQVHPKVGITKTAMDIVNSFIEDMFDQICSEAMKLCHYHKTHTISVREIQTATRLILPGELRKHAIMEGQKAVETFAKRRKHLQSQREKARGGKKGVFRGRKKHESQVSG